jgi:hypothetical protein
VRLRLQSHLGAHLERTTRRVGRERVEDRTLFITFRSLRVPTSAEGFDRLNRVRLARDGRFVVDALEG